MTQHFPNGDPAEAPPAYQLPGSQRALAAAGGALGANGITGDVKIFVLVSCSANANCVPDWYALESATLNADGNQEYLNRIAKLKDAPALWAYFVDRKPVPGGHSLGGPRRGSTIGLLKHIVKSEELGPRGETLGQEAIERIMNTRQGQVDDLLQFVMEQVAIRNKNNIIQKIRDHLDALGCKVKIMVLKELRFNEHERDLMARSNQLLPMSEHDQRVREAKLQAEKDRVNAHNAFQAALAETGQRTEPDEVIDAAILTASFGDAEWRLDGEKTMSNYAKIVAEFEKLRNALHGLGGPIWETITAYNLGCDDYQDKHLVAAKKAYTDWLEVKAEMEAIENYPEIHPVIEAATFDGFTVPTLDQEIGGEDLTAGLVVDTAKGRVPTFSFAKFVAKVTEKVYEQGKAAGVLARVSEAETTISEVGDTFAKGPKREQWKYPPAVTFFAFPCQCNGSRVKLAKNAAMLRSVPATVMETKLLFGVTKGVDALNDNGIARLIAYTA